MRRRLDGDKPIDEHLKDCWMSWVNAHTDVRTWFVVADDPVSVICLTMQFYEARGGNMASQSGHICTAHFPPFPRARQIMHATSSSTS